jgi:hypothetical protein
MKNLKKTLAENMLRFGTKNIDPKQVKRVISEQAPGLSADQRMRTSADQQLQRRETGQAAAADFKQIQEFNRRQGKVTYIQRAKTETTALKPMRIDAPFYNNMITIDRGLMVTKENVETQVNELVDTIIKTPGIDRDSLAITVTGAATTARPNDAPDTRLKDKGVTTVDHPGKHFGGIDVSKPENYNAGNQWLATQRAQAIINVLKPKLEAAGFKNLKLKTAAIVLPGGPRDDDKRYLNVDVNIQQKTNQITTTADLLLNFAVSYETTSGRTIAGGVSKKQSIAAPDQQVGTSTEVSDGYRARISLTYGQSNPGFSFNYGYSAVDIASTAGDDTSYPGTPALAGSPFLINGKFTATPIKSKGLILSATTDTSKLVMFLSTCGRFTKNQINQIIKDLSMIDSKLFQTLAQKGKGTFEDFVSAAGGSGRPMMGAEYGVTQIADYTTTPPSIKKV